MKPTLTPMITLAAICLIAACDSATNQDAVDQGTGTTGVAACDELSYSHAYEPSPQINCIAEWRCKNGPDFKATCSAKSCECEGAGEKRSVVYQGQCEVDPIIARCSQAFQAVAPKAQTPTADQGVGLPATNDAGGSTNKPPSGGDAPQPDAAGSGGQPCVAGGTTGASNNVKEGVSTCEAYWDCQDGKKYTATCSAGQCDCFDPNQNKKTVSYAGDCKLADIATQCAMIVQ